MGDVCIGTIEDVEFWVDKDLYEYWKHAHFTLKEVDAFGAGGFSMKHLLKRFKSNTAFTATEELE
jgi:uncharacterized protein (DUF779 family)